MNARSSSVCYDHTADLQVQIDRSIDLVIECTTDLIVVIKLNWINLFASGPLYNPPYPLV
jgi:hypothetical protein